LQRIRLHQVRVRVTVRVNAKPNPKHNPIQIHKTNPIPNPKPELTLTHETAWVRTISDMDTQIEEAKKKR
jgi:hypothetical protein